MKKLISAVLFLIALNASAQTSVVFDTRNYVNLKTNFVLNREAIKKMKSSGKTHTALNAHIEVNTYERITQ